MDRLVWPWWSSVQVEGGNSWQSWRLTLIGWFPRTTVPLPLLSENHFCVAQPTLVTAVALCTMCPTWTVVTDQYPLVVVITVCSGGLGSCWPWQGEYCQVLVSRCVFSARTRTAQHRSLELKNPAPRLFNRPPPLRAATAQGRSTNPSTTRPKLAPHSPSTTPCSGMPPSSKW